MTNEIKNVVITGASSGIGFETALQFAKQGHNVFALARRESKLNDLLDKSKELEGKIVVIPFDLSKFDKSILDITFEQLPCVDILINNAGKLLNKNFLEIEEKEIKEVLNVNYISVIKTIQYFHKYLFKAKSSHIVNISSVGGVTGSVKFSGLSVYSSSKGALSILSECLSQDFKEDNIVVNCLALGAVDTKMLNQAFPDYKAETSAEEIASYIFNFAMNASSVLNGVTQVVSKINP